LGLIFDEEYFNGEIGYANYTNYPHFIQRASWLSNFMSTNGYDHVTIMGAGYGYLIKALVENHGFTTSNVLGIENSSYAITQANALGYGVTQGYMVQSDLKTHTYGATDLVVSWNVLDCFENLTDVQTVLGRLDNINTTFIVVYCASEDPFNSNYNSLGYFLPSFFDVFTALNLKKQSDNAYLIRYHDGYVYEITWSPSKTGIPMIGFEIPTCWGAVSD
jgi:hypothetical protein